VPGNQLMTLRRGQIILILFSVWLLAITLPVVRFAPGRWEALSQRVTKNPPSLETLAGIILVFAAIFLAGLVFLLMKGRRRKRKDDDSYETYREPIPVPWSVYVVMVLLFAALGGLVWWARQPSKIPQPLATSLHSLAAPAEKATKVPPMVPPRGLPGPMLPDLKGMEYLLAIGLLAGLSWVVWRILKHRHVGEEPEVPDVGQIAAQAAVDLENGGELSDIVLRCYRDMCEILRLKAIMRPEMTAREFAQCLQQAGVREGEVLRLTALFERVRYGRYIAGPDERAEAIALLKTIENQYGKATDET